MLPVIVPDDDVCWSLDVLKFAHEAVTVTGQPAYGVKSAML